MTSCLFSHKNDFTNFTVWKLNNFKFLVKIIGQMTSLKPEISKLNSFSIYTILNTFIDLNLKTGCQLQNVEIKNLKKLLSYFSQVSKTFVFFVAVKNNFANE